MNVYLGLFLVAFSGLALQVTLVRLLSVTTWYHLAFFAISTAMLGMTAGATWVYLRPAQFRRDHLATTLARTCGHFAWSMSCALVSLCLIPLALYKSAMSFFSLFITTIVCALPFFFSGIIVSAVLTKHDLPMGRLYASDLVGASLGCLFVLGGLELFDAPSIILLCGCTASAAAICFAWKSPSAWWRRAGFRLVLFFLLAGLANSMSTSGIRPVIVKGGRIEPAHTYQIERWNSFSRIAVYKREHASPQYWGPSPLAPMDPIDQYKMNIDGEAGTTMRKFMAIDDIDHLRYDLTNIAYYLGRGGRACIIGVGGGRDVQSAVLFGHDSVTGIEINPIFVDLLQGEFGDFAGLEQRPGVQLVTAEARSYLSRVPEKCSIIQMSLPDC